MISVSFGKNKYERPVDYTFRRKWKSEIPISSSIEECMVCLETKSMYQMRGCSHCICSDCAYTMKNNNDYITHPFSQTVTVHIKIKLTETSLKCPYCRQWEPNNFKMSRLIKDFPRSYRLWMSLELNAEDETSHVIIPQRIFANGKKQVCYIHYRVDEGESITCINYTFWGGRRYRKMPMSTRDQLNEHKQKHIQKISMKRF